MVSIPCSEDLPVSSTSGVASSANSLPGDTVVQYHSYATIDSPHKLKRNIDHLTSELESSCKKRRNTQKISRLKKKVMHLSSIVHSTSV